MKTKMNISPVAKMSFAAVAMFLTTSAMNASETSSNASFVKLDAVISGLEENIRYQAPATDNAIYLDTEAIEAAYNLDNLTSAIDESLKYQAPEVSADVEDFEVVAAIERLDALYLALDESIKF